MKLSSHRHSNRFLFGLFILALPIFILLRWDSSAWLASQVNHAAEKNGYTIAYNQVSFTGLGLSFNEFQLRKTSSPPLDF